MIPDGTCCISIFGPQFRAAESVCLFLAIYQENPKISEKSNSKHIQLHFDKK